MELGVTRTPYGVENQSWLDTVEGLRRPLPVTLDGSLFTSGDFPDGVIPSGVVIAKATSGLYGPYSHAAGDTALQTAIGHLIDDSFCGAGRVINGGARSSVVLMTVGDVISNKLPTLASARGALDSYAIAQLTQIRYRTV